MFPVFSFLLAQLILAAPTCSRVTPPLKPNALSHSSNGTSTASWYAGWHSSDFTLQDVSWSKYSSVIYAFAVPTPVANIIGFQNDSDKALLPQFVQTAHANNVHALLSIGGWTGSRYFSSAVATDANRTAFAQAVMKLVSTYNLDGIEFDWEYPNRQGIGCNTISTNDSANFLSFLQTLRSQDGARDMIVSAAVSVKPFVGSDGNPMTDVSEFAKVLNYIEVMNYDVWGPWSDSVGPNAPLDDSCAPSSDQEGSAISAVKAWSTAGFPANQIILGVASYGHSFHVSNDSASQQPAGDKWDDTAAGVDECGNPKVTGGIFDFWGLIDSGFLTTNGTAASGVDYTFDNCSQTPFVYNPKSQVMVSYDDATSFAAKGEYIRDAGLAGFAMWEAGSDSDDILLDAIRDRCRLL
ncbi:glycoside hydrolase family 18 protein [Lactarius akahatsu]|uniref:Glycoside hydrolase family 18 protein n=1 Tax=Lactarius akahatsu TaxID=416441 RepID=A0AAD4LEY7_9AGAM|nr:glycoside hydrolase family 18 protein [Lactarius akahatsu]